MNFVIKILKKYAVTRFSKVGGCEDTPWDSTPLTFFNSLTSHNSQSTCGTPIFQVS